MWPTYAWVDRARLTMTLTLILSLKGRGVMQKLSNQGKRLTALRKAG